MADTIRNVSPLTHRARADASAPAIEGLATWTALLEIHSDFIYARASLGCNLVPLTGIEPVF